MKRHLNTLFVTSEGSYISRESQTLVVSRHGEKVLQVPALAIGSLVFFGSAAVSTGALALCAERGIAVAFLSRHGRFIARVSGPTSGNVLLRRDQFRATEDPNRSLFIARAVVLGKILNARALVLRAIRDHGDPTGELGDAVASMGRCAGLARKAESLDELRGVEGEAGRVYFGIFGNLIVRGEGEFRFLKRTRRPPLDPVNAMLSWTYALLARDVEAACEAIGLDPQMGFLHRDRPGRPGLALDLMEELRAPMADRVVLSLLNRRQVLPSDFETQPGGGVRMSEGARKLLITTYQKRKQEEVTHPFLGEKTTLGLVPHLQARLLARYLRGDLDGYPPYLVR